MRRRLRSARDTFLVGWGRVFRASDWVSEERGSVLFWLCMGADRNGDDDDQRGTLNRDLCRGLGLWLLQQNDWTLMWQVPAGASVTKKVNLSWPASSQHSVRACL